jgi:hypothetical protein
MARERINRYVKVGVLSAAALLLPSCTYDSSDGPDATINMVECVPPLDSNGNRLSEPITNSAGYILLPGHNQEEILKFDFVSIGWINGNITVTDLASDAVVTRFMGFLGQRPNKPESVPFADGNGTTVKYNNVILTVRKDFSPIDERPYLQYSISCVSSDLTPIETDN